MRAVLQRVRRGEVRVAGRSVGAIGEGLVVLVGISRTATERDAEYVARKVLNTRLWPDPDDGRPWKSAAAPSREVLLVSQFTLYAVLKGNKPDYHLAMAPDEARPFWDRFVERVRGAHPGGPEKVQQGEFGAMMDVDIVNDGPVTITIDSEAHFSKGAG